MAITISPFYAIVLLPFRRELSKAGCRFIVDQVARGGAYDGEIMAFGAMNSRDHEASIHYLMQLGYRCFQEGENPEDADFVCFELGEGGMPDWLECVEWRSLDDPKTGGQIWKLKKV